VGGYTPCPFRKPKMKGTARKTLVKPGMEKTWMLPAPGTGFGIVGMTPGLRRSKT
jgi:hypothetical protein